MPLSLFVLPKLCIFLVDKDYYACYIDVYCTVSAIKVVIPPKLNVKKPKKYNTLT
jgi:hypothetical protein